MGFLKNVFSSKQKEEEIGIRAAHKDYEYFIKELEFNKKAYQTILEDNKIIEEREGKLFPNNYDTLYGLLEKRSNLYYSKGDLPSTIINTYEKAYDNFILSLDEHFEVYDDLIRIISKSILFEISKEKLKKLSDFIQTMNVNKKLTIYKPDKIIGYLLNTIDKNIKIPKDLLFPILYEGIEKTIDSSDEEEAIIELEKYLNNWYNLHKLDSWYDNHKKYRGYSGYWCWEAAAVVKVMGLDDTRFKDHPHYPYDMVHWNDDESA